MLSPWSDLKLKPQRIKQTSDAVKSGGLFPVFDFTDDSRSESRDESEFFLTQFLAFPLGADC